MTVVKVSSALTEISQLSASARDYAQNAGFSAMSIMQIELAITEAAANCIEHAYNGKENGIIIMALELTDETLIVDLKDQGTPVTKNIFDGVSEEFEDPTQNILDLPENGRGLKIILSFMDEAMTHHSNGWNHITMKKSLDSSLEL